MSIQVVTAEPHPAVTEQSSHPLETIPLSAEGLVSSTGLYARVSCDTMVLWELRGV